MEPDNISPQQLTPEELAGYRALVDSAAATLRKAADALPGQAQMAVSFRFDGETQQP